MTMPLATPPDEPVPADVQRLLQARLSAAANEVRWHARSDTLIDTGSWLSRSPLHVVVCGDRLTLVAAGPRPLVLPLPLEALSRAVYNHVTGELSFPWASAGPAVPPLRLDPLVARSLLAFAPSPDNRPFLSGTPRHA